MNKVIQEMNTKSNL